MLIRRLLSAAVTLLLVSSVWAEALPPLSAQQLSEKLAVAEARVQDLDVYLSSTNRNIVGERLGTFSVSVRWAFRVPFGSRFRLEQTGMKEWDRGAKDQAAVSDIYGFDGKDTWSVNRFGDTVDEVVNAPARGSIVGGRAPGIVLGEGYRQLTYWHYGKPLSKILRLVAGVTVEPFQLEDRNVYRVSIPWNGEEHDEAIGPETLFLDPSLGYAIVRAEVDSGQPYGLSRLLRATDFAEAAPGVWFPRKATWEHLGPDGVMSDWECRVESIKANSGLGEELFAMAIPDGTPVSDMRSSITFATDDDVEAQSNATLRNAIMLWGAVAAAGTGLSAWFVRARRQRRRFAA